MTLAERITDAVKPFHLGQLVRVNVAKGGWRTDWRETYRVVAIYWEYRRTPETVRLAIATDHEIEKGYGWTDDFQPDDLLPA